MSTPRLRRLDINPIFLIIVDINREGGIEQVARVVFNLQGIGSYSIHNVLTVYLKIRVTFEESNFLFVIVGRKFCIKF